VAISDNARGALLMVGSMAAYRVNDTCMKLLSDELPLAQATALRGVLATLLLFALARGAGQLRLRWTRQDGGLVLLRTACEIGAVFFFLTALFNMPIANATAILQALPFTMTIAGALVLGERVGWRRMTAIILGFAGVLLIVRPGTEGFTIYSLHALAAVACITVRDLSVRRMSGAMPSLTVAALGSLGVTLVYGGASVAGPWAPVTPGAAGLLAAAALALLTAYALGVAAMRVGELAVVAPFRYAGLLAALVLGLVVFGEWPDALTLAGAGLVVATGLYMLYREQRLARAAASAAAAGVGVGPRV
jgi:S-adenosylmethionine uptake transporter